MHIAVIGAGRMGRGIAIASALGEHRVCLVDIDDSQLRHAKKEIGRVLGEGVSRGIYPQEMADAVNSRIELTENLPSAVEPAKLLIEAIPEKLELKRRTLASAADLGADTMIIASNTSAISIDAIAEAVPLPGRVLGIHFFNPAYKMPLVEIIRGRQSDPEAVKMALEFVDSINKESIMVQDHPGFASSRLGVTLGLEAIRMVESDIASVQDIDTAMKLGYGHPVGPLELSDRIGLDVRLHIADALASTLGSSFEPPDLLVEMVAAGHIGRASGEGFYMWEEGEIIGPAVEVGV